MQEFNIDRLKYLNQELNELESTAHNARSLVLDIIQLKKELADEELPKEEREVMKSSIDEKQEELQGLLTSMSRMQISNYETASWYPITKN